MPARRQVPDTLSTITPLPASRPGQWDRRNRRPRPLVRGERANTLPAIKPGEKVFRVSPDSKAGRATLRAWGRRHGYDVKPRGKVPAEVRAAFMEQNDIWTVTVVSALLPGAKDFSQHYHVRQGGYTRRRTIDPDMVRRELGAELFALLKEVPPR